MSNQNLTAEQDLAVKQVIKELEEENGALVLKIHAGLWNTNLNNNDKRGVGLNV